MGSLSSSTQLKTTMKFLVLASCVALSAAQYGLVGHPNGAVVPVGEPAVAAARADHFAAGGGRGALGYAGVGYAAAPAIAAARADHLAARGAQYAAIAPVAVAAPAIAAPAIAAPAIAAPIAAVPAVGYGYSGPLNLNTHLVAHPNGAVVPADEPAVAAARADHFAAGGGLAGGLYAGAAVGPYGYGAGYGYGLVAHPNGAVVPVDEPAVQAARADHFAAKGAVY